MAFACFHLFFILAIFCASLQSYHLPKAPKQYGRLGGQNWNNIDDFEGFNVKILGPVLVPTVFNHMGDIPTTQRDNADRKKNDQYNLNVGRALEVLRRELPFVFVLTNLDFSIFSSHVIVADGNNNKMMMPISLYSGAVKSLKIAASFSSIYPSMNVKKIEYIEDSATIQCLVDVVLPDTVRVEGQAVWEGMFYFGLDGNGLISSHIFDRKISHFKPSLISASVSQFPWLQKRANVWQPDLVTNHAGASSSSSNSVGASTSAESTQNN